VAWLVKFNCDADPFDCFDWEGDKAAEQRFYPKDFVFGINVNPAPMVD
jgi:hypothetical protein